MNVKQQLNNAFYALFIGALLIGAKDSAVLSDISLCRILFFIFLFFLRLKIYLDDNENFKITDPDKLPHDFVFGYMTSLLSWMAFPVSAYRIWDVNLNKFYIFLACAIVLCSLWTFSASFIVKDAERQKRNKQWLLKNFIYLCLLALLYFNENILSTFKCINVGKAVFWTTLLYSILLLFALFHDYLNSKTLENIKT